MDNNSEILKNTRVYVEEFLKKLPPGFLFHNLNHTLDVFNNCEEISSEYDLTDNQKEVLLIAALFHDTGYAYSYNDHEEESIKIAEDFLKKKKYKDENISKVIKLIRSTKGENSPVNLSEEILHDADIAHIGKKEFFNKGELLLLELEKIKNESYSDMDWEKKQIDFLGSTKFYTSYAKKYYEKRLAKNIALQRANISRHNKQHINIRSGKYIGRGIETLYRTTFRNHINLSEIADGKANMMISINTIILTVIITLAGSGLTLSEKFFIEKIRFTFPIFILLLASLASVIFAILSAKPNVTKGKVDIEDLEKSKKSILFFGNFVMLEMEKFIEGLKKLKNNQTLLYDNMSIDLFFLGKVLAKKYNLLSYSYFIFMIGLIISVVGFILIFFITYA